VLDWRRKGKIVFQCRMREIIEPSTLRAGFDVVRVKAPRGDNLITVDYELIGTDNEPAILPPFSYITFPTTAEGVYP
jgi:hypothetical protein